MLSPLPRYLSASCCVLAGHVQNRDDTGFVEKVTEDLSTLKRQIKDFCHINHLGATTCLNTAVLMTNPDGGRSLMVEERDHLLSLWGPDPVHPRPEGYNLLATNILALLKGESESAASPLSWQPSESAGKRTGPWQCGNTNTCSEATVDPTGATGGEDGGGSAATEHGIAELQSGTSNRLRSSYFYMIQP